MTHPRLAAALRLQLERRRAVLEQGGRHVGWKIGGGIPEIEAVTGGGPAVGYLTSASQLPAGGVYRASGDGALHADTEVVIEVGRDVDPAGSVSDAAAAIAGLAVGLELVDLERPPGDLEGIVAANVLHRAFAVGPNAPAAASYGEARSIVNGELRDARRARGDHGETVRTVARLLDAAGERLRGGDRILAGSVVQVPVAPGDAVVAEIDGLGSVAVSIS